MLHAVRKRLLGRVSPKGFHATGGMQECQRIWIGALDSVRKVMIPERVSPTAVAKGRQPCGDLASSRSYSSAVIGRKICRSCGRNARTHQRLQDQERQVV